MHVLDALRILVSRLSRRRGFLALTIAVLGLGLGAALTVLEIADALFWRLRVPLAPLAVQHHR